MEDLVTLNRLLPIIIGVLFLLIGCTTAIIAWARRPKSGPAHPTINGTYVMDTDVSQVLFYLIL